MGTKFIQYNKCMIVHDAEMEAELGMELGLVRHTCSAVVYQQSFIQLGWYLKPWTNESSNNSDLDPSLTRCFYFFFSFNLSLYLYFTLALSCDLSPSCDLSLSLWSSFASSLSLFFWLNVRTLSRVTKRHMHRRMLY